MEGADAQPDLELEPFSLSERLPRSRTGLKSLGVSRNTALIVLVCGFVGGGILALGLALGLTGSTPPAPVPRSVVVEPVPSSRTPLDVGVSIGMVQPEGLQWSPDARTIAWYTFDPSLGRMVVSIVQIDIEGFYGTEVDVGARSWTTGGTSTAHTVVAAGSLVKVQDLAGRTVAVRDVHQQFGHGLAVAPSLITTGARTLVVVASRAPGQSWTLHVLDVSHDVTQF
jgi:hypothetical protein